MAPFRFDNRSASSEGNGLQQMALTIKPSRKIVSKAKTVAKKGEGDRAAIGAPINGPHHSLPI